MFGKKSMAAGTGESTPSVKRLPCSHGDMSLDHWHPCEKLGSVVDAWEHSAMEAETGGSLGRLDSEAG